MLFRWFEILLFSVFTRWSISGESLVTWVLSPPRSVSLECILDSPPCVLSL